jgi:hypothetical protein
MAAFTPEELQELRSALARNTDAHHWDKPTVNNTLQVIEDFMQQTSTRQAVGNAIENAAPGVFNVAEKTQLFAIWSLTFARRQGLT